MSDTARVPQSEALTAMLAVAAVFAKEVLAAYQATNPQQGEVLTASFTRGEVRFDVCIRDFTGFAPNMELVAVVDDREVVIGSMLLKRRVPE